MSSRLASSPTPLGLGGTSRGRAAEPTRFRCPKNVTRFAAKRKAAAAIATVLATVLVFAAAGCGGEKQRLYDRGAFNACIEGQAGATPLAELVHDQSPGTARTFVSEIVKRAPTITGLKAASGETAWVYVADDVEQAEAFTSWIHDNSVLDAGISRTGNFVLMVLSGDGRASQGFREMIGSCESRAQRT